MDTHKPSHLLPLFIACVIAGLLLWGTWNSYKQTFDIRPQQEQTTPEEQEELSFIPIFEHDPILGNPQAGTTIVVFEDFLCESCRTQNQLLNQLIEKHSTAVRIIWKDFPILTFPYPSEQIHAYGFCANRQRTFEAFKDAAFTLNAPNEGVLDQIAREVDLDTEQLETCLARADYITHFEKNKILARALNIQAAPAIFVNNTQITPPSTVSEWESRLGL